LSLDPSRSPEAKKNNPQLFNLYAYGGNNPMSFIDPDGRNIRLTLRMPSGDAGHIILQVVDPKSGAIKATWSFGPGRSGAFWDAVMLKGISVKGKQTENIGAYLDSYKGKTKTAELATTAEQDDKLAAAINDRKTQNEDYNLYENNCATTALELIQSVVPEMPRNITSPYPMHMYLDFWRIVYAEKERERLKKLEAEGKKVEKKDWTELPDVEDQEAPEI
jgi:hypothetical protein